MKKFVLINIIPAIFAFQPCTFDPPSQLKSTVACQMTLSSNHIKNFRQAAFLPNIIRCAETDCLADMFLTGEKQKDNAIDEGAQVVLERAGLVLDLRSPSERDETKARLWLKNSGFAIQENAYTDDSTKTMLRIDVLSPSRLFEYLSENWLTPSQRALSAVYFAVDIRK